MSDDDMWDNPGAQAWRERAETDLWPKIEESSMTMQLLPTGEPDAKFAVELGFCIMLDKPIIAVVMPGVKVPSKLAQIADEIVEVDPSRGLRSQESAQQVTDAMDRLSARMEQREEHAQQGEDTLAHWLWWRFSRGAQDVESWKNLPHEDRLFFEHEAAAVRRAVTRGGWKT